MLLVYKEVNLRIASGGCSDASQNQCVVISYDEKPGMQAIATRVADMRPTRTSLFIARDSEYRRLGTISLLAGLNLLDGQIIPLIRDNHTVHTSAEMRQYLSTVLGRFEFVFTPKHGSWLNLVESFFAKLT